MEAGQEAVMDAWFAMRCFSAEWGLITLWTLRDSKLDEALV